MNTRLPVVLINLRHVPNEQTHHNGAVYGTFYEEVIAIAKCVFHV